MSTNRAFVFPGQGSQTQAMLSDFADEPIVMRTFELASEILGYDVWQLIQEDNTRLNQTEYTQPALLAASCALYRLWHQSSGPDPIILAGHSLGEYTALVIAGALDFSDALRLVQHRGQFMSQALPQNDGAMAAIIGLSPQNIDTLCQAPSITGSVWAANYNSPQQTVVAGTGDAIDALLDLAKAEGAKIAKRIDVSVPSHCPLMAPAQKKLKDYFAPITIHDSQLPVVHNVNGQIAKNVDAIRSAIIDQLTEPVRWVDSMQTIKDMGITHVVECGPGKVLAGLIKRIDKSLKTFTTDSTSNFDSAISACRAEEST